MARMRETLTESEVWTPRKNSEEKKKVPHRMMGTPTHKGWRWGSPDSDEGIKS